jgi:quercetin dioxygenase-like cupin family protein
MTFLELGPERARIDSFSPPGDEREALHVHPKQTSGAEVLAGSLVYEVDGATRRVGAGESIEIPPGVPHRFWNDGEEEAHSVQFFEPALDSAAFFETFFALAQQGKLDEEGMPSLLPMALLVPEFGDEIRPVSPPWPLLKALAVALSPVARLRGHRSRYVT